MPAGFKKQLTTVYDASLKLTEAFIGTDASKAKAAATGVINALSGVDMKQLSGAGPTPPGWSQLNAMNAALKTIRSSGDIEQQRLAYAQFEDALYQ